MEDSLPPFTRSYALFFPIRSIFATSMTVRTSGSSFSIDRYNLSLKAFSFLLRYEQKSFIDGCKASHPFHVKYKVFDKFYRYRFQGWQEMLFQWRSQSRYQCDQH